MQRAQEIDTSAIELSGTEKKILRTLLNSGVMPDEPLTDEMDPYPYLHRTNLIERCYSEKYPYEHPGPGVITIPLNAIRITDKGRVALRRSQSNSSHWKWQIVCDIATLVISLAAFIKSFFF
ncbi:hypothetical protein ACEVJL_09425 [Pseudoflavonifractor sp. P01025]|uniref:hypothetical protein n=1 Tax=Flintibacter porci TaxID=3342383 RepID=UPI0035B58EFE